MNEWWRNAVIYQVYIRSFADGNDDGLGDIAGIRAKLGYLADLGVDAIWINPWYPSPMADAGYDVADYRDIDAAFGTLADAEALITEAHDAGIRVILDIVPNHCSSAHVWFQAALAGGRGCPERELFVFRDGRGVNGELPPNDWRSEFGGRGWTRVTEPDGSPGQWYLHLFAAEQPDWNWEHPTVRADFEHTLRFWFDRGVDGFRIDVAHSLIKHPALADVGKAKWAPGEHPHWDREPVHEVYRAWRKVADSYDPPRIFVAEAWVANSERLTRYLRSDELHSAFNFHYLQAAWTAKSLHSTIDATMADHRATGAPATWVLANHDVARLVSRLARPTSVQPNKQLDDLLGHPADYEIGLRRARAAALLMLALPGNAYVYQGEELGLAEVEDLPEAVLQDPTFHRTHGKVRGRDGCRVPLPWSGSSAPFGFSHSATPWLPQPAGWAVSTAEELTADRTSMLWLYRDALRLRRQLTTADDELRWLPPPADALHFRRDGGWEIVVNLGPEPIELPAGDVLLSSSPLPGGPQVGTVPPDTTVWLHTTN